MRLTIFRWGVSDLDNFQSVFLWLRFRVLVQDLLSRNDLRPFRNSSMFCQTQGLLWVSWVFCLHVLLQLKTPLGTGLCTQWRPPLPSTQVSDNEVACKCRSVLVIMGDPFLCFIMWLSSIHTNVIVMTDHVSTVTPCPPNQRYLPLTCLVVWRDPGT